MNEKNEHKPSPIVGHLKYTFCLGLHCALVGVHAALIIIALNGHPLHLVHHNVFTAVFFQAISYGPNALGKAYLVILLYYTQKLALRHDLHTRSNLTAIHDKSIAWLGLGSAVPVLWNQISTPASVFGVLCITLYLGGLFILGITTPILLTVGAVYNGETRFMNLTSFLPYVGSNAYDIKNAFPIVELIPLMDVAVATYGLQDYLIYDTPTFSGSQAVLVDATRVNVNCQALPDAAQNGSFDTKNGTFSFSIHPEVQDVMFTPTARAMNIVPLLMKNTSAQAPATFIVASTMLIVDDTYGVTGPSVEINPAIVPENCTNTNDCAQFASLQILACDADMWNTNVDVIPLWGLEDASSIEKVNSTIWRNWQLPQGSTKPIVEWLNWFPYFSSESGTVNNYNLASGDYEGFRTLSVLEENVMETLGFYRANVHEVTLGQLDLTLERAIAAVYWRSALSLAYASQTPLGPASINIADTYRYSIQITKWPPIIGLATSVLLLILAAILTVHAQPAKTLLNKLGEPGVLQLTWLLGHDSSTSTLLQEHVQDPESKELRKQGRCIEVNGWIDSKYVPRDSEQHPQRPGHVRGESQQPLLPGGQVRNSGGTGSWTG